MEFHHLIISTYVLFSFALARETYAHASLPDEDYWHTVWPNTPIPSALQELLKQAPGAEINDHPMQIDDTQYPQSIFLQHDLYLGKQMNVPFSNIPFTLPWGVYVDKKEGYTLEDLCLNQPVKGEEKYCAKSLGTLIDFVTSKFGRNTKVLSSSFIKKQEQYTLEGVQNLGNKLVACHRLNFKKIVFSCHRLNGTTAFMVPLIASDGSKTQALAVCHADTSSMDHALIHQILKFNIGTNPLCHFLCNKDMLWVPNA